MLRNFDSESLDQEQDRGERSSVVIEESVEVTHLRPSSQKSYLLVDEDSWEWREVRDYVVHQIESRFGAVPRDERKEYGIFHSFVSRWPDGQAARIAKVAFEVFDGQWRGAPISVQRFCKNSDPFFAQVIIERLRA